MHRQHRPTAEPAASSVGENSGDATPHRFQMLRPLNKALLSNMPRCISMPLYTPCCGVFLPQESHKDLMATIAFSCKSGALNVSSSRPHKRYKGGEANLRLKREGVFRDTLSSWIKLQQQRLLVLHLLRTKSNPVWKIQHHVVSEIESLLCMEYQSGKAYLWHHVLR